MQLNYVTSSARSIDLNQATVALLRGLGHGVRVWDRAPATLIGRPRGEVVIVDAVSDVVLARTPTLAQRETAVQHSGSLWLDRGSLTVGDDELVIALTLTEAVVVSLFFDHPDVVVSRDMLLERAWAQSAGFASRNVDTFICRLRCKLGRHGERITTVRGAGYTFVPERAALQSSAA